MPGQPGWRRWLPDGVLSNVSYLPLAGAAQNRNPRCRPVLARWADLFAHFFGNRGGLPPSTPKSSPPTARPPSSSAPRREMPWPTLAASFRSGPLPARGKRCDLGLGRACNILVALGGIAHRLPVDAWLGWKASAGSSPPPGTAATPCPGQRIPRTRLSPDLVASVDALIGKPGYGTFTEAACSGHAGTFQRRDDWPEQACLIDWLQERGRVGKFPARRWHQARSPAPLNCWPFAEAAGSAPRG